MVDHRSLDVGGTRLSFQVSGPPDAPPVVLLHALGEDATDWDLVAVALAAGRRVYALDLRGHGLSDWPGEYSLELMRADVIGFLDALALDRVDLIGHSMGGIVACLLAEDHPRRVNRLVLEDVAAPRPRAKTTPTRPEGELTFDWDMVLAIRKQMDEPPRAWLERLGLITAKTLVVGGGPRSHVPQDGVAELGRLIPSARVVTIAAGHLIHRGAPKAFTEAAGTFLRSDGEDQQSW